MRIRVATLNLYHFAEPGVWWYVPAASGGGGYDDESWSAKLAWLRMTLDAMAPDIISFQEVVSVDALSELCRDAGYPYLATVSEPRFSAEHPEVYNRPVNAVASRWPLRAEAVVVDPAVSRTLGFAHERAFRRAPVKALAAAPGFGDVLVYCAHLKSPGVGVADALMAGQHEPPEDDDAFELWTHRALSRAHAAATIQRSAEAALLYHDVVASVAAAPKRPVFVTGDLNDTPESGALAALNPGRAMERDGGDGAFGTGPGEPPPPRYALFDAYRLAPKDLRSDRRPLTFRRGADGAVIDFVLVSAALHPGGADQVARVVSHAVMDQHFVGMHPALTSDHAPICVTIETI